jgi:hypothetical protein
MSIDPSAVAIDRIGRASVNPEYVSLNSEGSNLSNLKLSTNAVEESVPSKLTSLREKEPAVPRSFGSMAIDTVSPLGEIPEHGSNAISVLPTNTCRYSLPFADGVAMDRENVSAYASCGKCRRLCSRKGAA